MRSLNLIIITTFYFLIGCQKHSNEKLPFDRDLIKILAEENDGWPSRFSFKVFVKCASSGLAEISLDELPLLYNEVQYAGTYADFLKKALDQTIFFDVFSVSSCFNLNKEVTSRYENNNFDAFLEIYFTRDDEKFYLKRDVEYAKFNTIFYYCFINNYLMAIDDYRGAYILTKTSFYVDWI